MIQSDGVLVLHACFMFTSTIIVKLSNHIDETVANNQWTGLMDLGFFFLLLFEKLVVHV